jgi:hypothetical protein
MRVIRSEKCDGRDMCHVWKTIEAHTGLWWGDLRERDNLKHLGIDGKDNIKIDLQEVGWIDLAQETDRWRVFVNEVMNLRVP